MEEKEELANLAWKFIRENTRPDFRFEHSEKQRNKISTNNVVKHNINFLNRNYDLDYDTIDFGKIEIKYFSCSEHHGGVDKTWTFHFFTDEIECELEFEGVEETYKKRCSFRIYLEYFPHHDGFEYKEYSLFTNYDMDLISRIQIIEDDKVFFLPPGNSTKSVK